MVRGLQVASASPLAGLGIVTAQPLQTNFFLSLSTHSQCVGDGARVTTVLQTMAFYLKAPSGKWMPKVSRLQTPLHPCVITPNGKLDEAQYRLVDDVFRGLCAPLHPTPTRAHA